MRYKIADIHVQMQPEGRLLQQAAPYAVPELEQGQMYIDCETARKNTKGPWKTDWDKAEYMLTGMEFARELLNYDGFQLHASAVLLEGKAYLFSADSGTGKSTHAEKWCRLFGAQYLNDDKPVLRRTTQGWQAYGTPWSGKNDLSLPAGAPIQAVAMLRRGQENKIRRIEPQEAIPLFIGQCQRFLTAQQMSLQLGLLDKLLQEVPVFLLECRNDDAAAQLSRQYMR